MPFVIKSQNFGQVVVGFQREMGGLFLPLEALSVGSFLGLTGRGDDAPDSSSVESTQETCEAGHGVDKEQGKRDPHPRTSKSKVLLTRQVKLYCAFPLYLKIHNTQQCVLIKHEFIGESVKYKKNFNQE